MVAHGDWQRVTPEVQGVSVGARRPLGKVAAEAKIDVASLDVPRLRAILRKYGAFPPSYRLLGNPTPTPTRTPTPAPIPNPNPKPYP